MSVALALFAPLFAQIGPGGAIALPPLEIPRRSRAAASLPAVAAPAPRLAACLALVGEDPAKALDAATTWLGTVIGADRGEALQCQGAALAALGRWNEAESAFIAGRDAAPPAARGERARRGAMAGNAALARLAPAAALAALDQAHSDALAAGLAGLTGEISIDRARALVALTRLGEASAALAEARAQAPLNPQGWLLSATLARRQNRLAEAQAEIEQAARLAPADPEIGLEAGVIAALAGRDEAARASFRAVLALAPDTPLARTAQGYLDQLGPPPARSPQ